MAIAVVVDAILDVGRRQELRLADLARISADQVAQRKIAAIEDLQRGDHSRWKRSVRRQSCASVATTRMTGAGPCRPSRNRLEAPDRHDHARRHAELPLDAPEQRRMPRQELGRF